MINWAKCSNSICQTIHASDHNHKDTDRQTQETALKISNTYRPFS